MDGIIALDPAGPLFESNIELKLGKSDAKAVQGLNSIEFQQAGQHEFQQRAQLKYSVE